MALFLTLLPLYLFGNIHCFGMCGPLVMMIGQHHYRFFYFLGRLLSFALAGAVAGEMGAVLHIFLKQYHLSEVTSFVFGSAIILIGFKSLLNWPWPRLIGLRSPLAKLNQFISQLMLRDTSWGTFLFGFFTVALPCGQSLVVFSACALAGDVYVGFFNGFALALLTTPSLILAMHTHRLFRKVTPYYQTILGTSAILVGLLTFCRGLAEGGWISHWILNPESPSAYHIVIF